MQAQEIQAKIKNLKSSRRWNDFIRINTDFFYMNKYRCLYMKNKTYSENNPCYLFWNKN